MSEKKKKPVSEVLREQQSKERDRPLRVVGRAAATNAMKKIYKQIDSGKDRFEGDFFIYHKMIRDRAFDKTVKQDDLEFNICTTIRDQVTARKLCPLPCFGTAVYHYRRKDEELALKWVLPPENWAIEMWFFPERFDEKDLDEVGIVHDHFNGKLFKLCMELNGEACTGQQINEYKEKECLKAQRIYNQWIKDLKMLQAWNQQNPPKAKA